MLLLKDEGVEVTKQDEALLYTYTAPEDKTIDSIGHYDSVATISFEEAVFPLTLKRGQSVDVFIYGLPYQVHPISNRLLLNWICPNLVEPAISLVLLSITKKGYE